MTTLRLVAAHLAARPDPRTDAELVADFVRHADQPAFAELVRRHGPMVLGVCRRALGTTPDADDAFQATFLVLVRRARSTAWRDSLGPWLHAVAARVANKARAVQARRRTFEKQTSPMTPEPTARSAEPDDLGDLLDEELGRLPEAYRRPLVLCELQGRSRAEAAGELGLAEGTLSSRLARGRRMLRDRLARRGVAGPAAGLAVAVPAGLAEATTGRAVAVLTGAGGAVPAAVMSLTERVVKAMMVNWKLTAVALAIGLGVTGLGFRGVSDGPPVAAAQEVKANPPARPAAAGPADPVATIFGDVKLSREAYADYLIRRVGKHELEQYVNKQIIAHAFNKQGWVLRGDEIQTALADDCRSMGITRHEFETQVLPKYNKTPDTWVDDVIIPRLMLARLCEREVKPPTEAELRAAFNQRYGEKRACRVVAWPKGDAAAARDALEKLRTSEAAFAAAARSQSDSTLAAAQGQMATLPAVGGVTGIPEAITNAAAKLKAGQVSPLVDSEDRVYVLKCDRVIAPDPTKSFDGEKPALMTQILQAKINQEVPRLFAELKRNAKPQDHFSPLGPTPK